MGGAISAPTMIAMLEGCKSSTTSEAAGFAFSADYKNLVAEIAEIIIPKTSTPGAKDAGVGPFIEMMLKDCYTPLQQEHFKKGLDTLEEEAKKLTGGKSFLEASKEQQTELLKKMEAAAKEELKQKEQTKKQVDAETGLTKETKGAKEIPVPFFKLMKELTLLGYFTSEQGATKALAYDPVPGKYVGCIKMEPGQKTWAL